MGNKETTTTVPAVTTTEEKKKEETNENPARVSPLLDPIGYISSLAGGSSWTRATLAQKIPAKMTAEERQVEVANLGRNIAELNARYNRHQEKGRCICLLFFTFSPVLLCSQYRHQVTAALENNMDASAQNFSRVVQREQTSCATLSKHMANLNDFMNNIEEAEALVIMVQAMRSQTRLLLEQFQEAQGVDIEKVAKEYEDLMQDMNELQEDLNETMEESSQAPMPMSNARLRRMYNVPSKNARPLIAAAPTTAKLPLATRDPPPPPQPPGPDAQGMFIVPLTSSLAPRPRSQQPVLTSSSSSARPPVAKKKPQTVPTPASLLV